MKETLASLDDPRAFIFPDIHGCLAELKRLMAKIAPRKQDKLVFVGDLVDRGPESAGVIDYVRELGAQVVLGNHEEATLRRRLRDKDTLSPHHRRTIEQLQSHHYDYLESLPAYIELPEFKTVVVHAGVVPFVPISQQKTYFLLHGQHLLKPEDKGRNGWQPTSETWHPSRAPHEAVFWADAYEEEAERWAQLAADLERTEDVMPAFTMPFVVYGHTVFEKPYIQKHSAGIDTGCCFGMKMTAIELPSRTLHQVDADWAYHESRRQRFVLPSGDVLYS